MLGDVDLSQCDHPTGKVKNLTDVARAFNIAYKSLLTGWRDKGMPVEPDGTYDLEKIFYWKVKRPNDPDRIKIQREKTGGDQSSGVFFDAAEEKRKHEARLKKEQADAAARKNRMEEGDIVHRRDVERFVSQLLMHTRDTFSELPNAMAAAFPANARKELKDLLAEQVNIRLRMLHRYIPEIAEIKRDVK